jgi:hypothetical protein
VVSCEPERVLRTIYAVAQLDTALGDAEVRPALRSLLRSEHAGEDHSVFIEELGFCGGRVRIDLAVVNGRLHGYEIKSDRDTLERLDGQLEIYNRVLDRATLVVGERHLDEAKALLPGWWGLLRIDAGPDGPRFTTIRRGHRNPRRHARTLAELLWRDEALALLGRRDAARGVKSKPRSAVWDRLCEYFHVEEIAAEVRRCLKAREARRGLPRLG